MAQFQRDKSNGRIPMGEFQWENLNGRILRMGEIGKFQRRILLGGILLGEFQRENVKGNSPTGEFPCGKLDHSKSRVLMGEMGQFQRVRAQRALLPYADPWSCSLKSPSLRCLIALESFCLVFHSRQQTSTPPPHTLPFAISPLQVSLELSNSFDIFSLEFSHAATKTSDTLRH